MKNLFIYNFAPLNKIFRLCCKTVENVFSGLKLTGLKNKSHFEENYFALIKENITTETFILKIKQTRMERIKDSRFEQGHQTKLRINNLTIMTILNEMVFRI